MAYKKSNLIKRTIRATNNTTSKSGVGVIVLHQQYILESVYLTGTGY